MNRTTPRFLLGVSLALALASSAFAQSATTGVIRGRVLIPTTGEFVKNAEVRVRSVNAVVYTEEAGVYRLPNIPAGEVTVEVSYPGYNPASAAVTVAAGVAATADFELTAEGATTTNAAGDVVQLSTFVVNAEKEGNSAALAQQKASMTIGSVVSTDAFGEVRESNIGEFLKYVPGIAIDYVETDTRAARIGGMEATYGAITLDGNSVANIGGFGSSSRQFNFESLSINNIESIEVNKTLAADLPANGGAGRVNLRSRSPLDRERTQFNFMVGTVGNSEEYSYKKSARHDDTTHRKIRPTFTFDYTDKFFDGRLGLQVNGSHSSVFKEQARQSITYDNTSTQARAAGFPLVTQINFKDGPKLTTKWGGGLNLDFQATPKLRFSLKNSLNRMVDNFTNRNLGFRVDSARVDPSSTPTKLVANANNGTRILLSGAEATKVQDTFATSFGFVYKGDRLTIDGSTAYSLAREQNAAGQQGAVARADVSLRNISFTAERADVSSDAWTFNQTGGLPWDDLSSFGAQQAESNNIENNWNRSRTQLWTQQLNAKYVLPIRTPTFIKVGYYNDLATRDRQDLRRQVLTWVGPASGQAGRASKQAPFPASIADFRIAQAFGGNLTSLPVVDRSQLNGFLASNPEFFVLSEARRIQELDSLLGSNQDSKELVNAAYVMANTRLGKFQFQAGLRYEHTETTVPFDNPVPNAANPFPAGTEDFVRFKWSQPRIVEKGRFDNWLGSVSAVYRPTDNLVIKTGFHRALKRVELADLAAKTTINEASETVTIGNPNLTAETSRKWAGTVEYYFKHAGFASLHVFQTDTFGAIETTTDQLASDFGFGDDPLLQNFRFTSKKNIPGKRRIRGMELAYNQQLTFLPGEFLRGTRINVSYGQFTSTPRFDDFVERTFSGNISNSFRRFRSRVGVTWTDDIFTGNNTVPSNAVQFAGDREVLKNRLLTDVEFSYKFTKNLDVFVSGSNVFGIGKRWLFKGTDSRLRQLEEFGGQWTTGIRGRF